MITPRYRGACPNCGGKISAERLSKGLPCSACLPEPPRSASVESVARALSRRGALAGYAWLYALEEAYKDFSAYFRGKTGSSLWSAQKSWARRLLRLESMAIIAPTGVGKTTLLSVYAAYRAARSGWRVLYLAPTENLVRQIAARIEAVEPGVCAWYASSAGRRVKEEMLSRLERGEFSVLVVTTGFLQKRFDYIARHAPFNLVIVDDVDSLLRNSRNVERVLKLLGYSDEAIGKAMELVKARLALYTALAQGREERVEEARRRVAELEAELRRIAGEPLGQLVIASATGRPRGVKHLLFKELLGFEVGGGSDYLRNVEDTYHVTGDLAEGVIEVVRRLGPGGIVFVSQAYGKHYAKLLAEKLNAQGIPAAVALAGSRRAVEKLEEGSVWVIVGVASRYGVVVRGIDLPERVRYTVFYGAPGRLIPLPEALKSPSRLLRVLLYLSDQGAKWAGEAAVRIRRLLDRIPDPSIVAAALQGKVKAEGLLAELVEEITRAAAGAEEALRSMLEERDSIIIGGMVVERTRTGEALLFTPDAPTYLQASGRASRLHKGVMTFGLSVVVESRLDRVKALERRLSLMARTSFKPFSEVDLDDALRRIEETRKGKGRRVSVKSVLLVVESPTKARTIAWFWGRPSKRRVGRLVVYETNTLDPKSGTVYLLQVTATRGHIYDLAVEPNEGRYGVHVDGGVVEPVYTTVKRCLSCGHQFTDESAVCPRCGSPMIVNSQQVVDTLRRLAVEVDEIIVATDPDREGEKIAWDVLLAVKPYNPRVSRGWFHEVTPEAVLNALRNPSPFNERLVEAQIVRRIVDRWIGFALSEHLWSVFKKPWLGAGRVQTPVLGWVIDRYQAWRETRGYKVVAKINGFRVSFFTGDREKARAAAAAGKARVVSVDRWVEEVNPAPPFTTDSLIYEAGRVYGYPARLVMKLAQDLFESGLITYHRTDSTRVSPAGIALAREYLESHGLGGLYRGRQWGEGGAHEAIRPTRPLDAGEVERAVLEGTLRVPVKLTRAHVKLYDLIFRRFIASQMAPATVEKAALTLELGGLREEVTVVTRVVREGFTAVYKPRLAPWASSVEAGDEVPVKEARVVRASREKLLTSGDLVRLMKERGLGRPSTYAKVIEANRRHGYVIESRRVGYLIPTKLGMEVYRYLASNFGDLVSEATSRRLEEELDSIERGAASPLDVLDATWGLITASIRRAVETATLGAGA
ncbi:reverse gyrase [Stetteria hydrogenophila]